MEERAWKYVLQSPKKLDVVNIKNTWPPHWQESSSEFFYHVAHDFWAFGWSSVSFTELPLGNSCIVIPVLQVGKLRPNVLCPRSQDGTVAVALGMLTPAPWISSATKFSVKSAEMQDDSVPWSDCKGFWTGIMSYCIKGLLLDIYWLFDECWGNSTVNSFSLGAWQCTFWPLSFSISHWVATKSRDFM